MLEAAYRTVFFESLGSTNDESMSRLRTGDAGGVFIVAGSQTGGRGRHGRRWTSPPGNLYASLGLLDPAPLALAPQLGFVAGVALISALRALLGDGPRLALKWPNDVLLDGAKLAGILLESAILPSGGLACVAGFGVNCASHPDGLPYPATDLTMAGAFRTPEVVLAALSKAFAASFTRWDHGANFAAIRSDWLGFAGGLGDTINVASPSGTVSGHFGGLGPGGHLLVDTVHGRVTIDAGDVFLPGLPAGAMHQNARTRSYVASEGRKALERWMRLQRNSCSYRSADWARSG